MGRARVAARADDAPGRTEITALTQSFVVFTPASAATADAVV